MNAFSAAYLSWKCFFDFLQKGDAASRFLCRSGLAVFIRKWAIHLGAKIVQFVLFTSSPFAPIDSCFTVTKEAFG